MAQNPILMNSDIDVGHLRDASYDSGKTTGSQIAVAKPRERSRDQVSNWHQSPSSSDDLEMSIVGKTVSGAKDIGETAFSAGQTIFAQALDYIKSMFTSGGSNKTVSDIFKLLLGGGLGLGTIKSLLVAPKYIANGKEREKSSPLIVTIGKFFAGASVAYGILGGLLGGAGISLGGIGVGLLAFIALGFVKSMYENPQSIPSKIASTLGLREKLNDSLDFLKIEKTFMN